MTALSWEEWVAIILFVASPCVLIIALAHGMDKLQRRVDRLEGK